MPYPASSYPEGVDLTIIAGNQLHQVINGEANEVISTTSGDIPSVRKALADSMMFKVPIDWVQGEVTTDPLETRLYNGQPYWAPEATLANPITLGSSPVATTDWLLAPQGYRNDYNLGKYQAGILISDSQEYVVYDGKSYFATNPPYTTISTAPDADGNLFAGGYTTIKDSANVFSNTNLLSNHNFLVPSPEDITHPSETPTNYSSGTQIFSGVYVGTDITNLTYIDGRVSFSGGDLYFSVPNTGGLERLNANQFVASVADFDGKPRTRGVSFALVGDEYRVTVGIDALSDGADETLLGSVKFEQGKVATRHEFKSLFDVYGHPNMGIFSANAFGAAANKDSSQAIKDAIDAAISTNTQQFVTFSPGMYYATNLRTTAKVQLDLEGVTIKKPSDPSLSDTFVITLVNSTDSEDWSLSGGVIDGNSNGQSFYHLLRLENENCRVTLDNMRIGGNVKLSGGSRVPTTETDAILVTKASKFTLTNSKIFDVCRNGISFIDGNCKNSVIKYNEFEDCGLTGVDYEPNTTIANQFEYVNIVGNKFKRCWDKETWPSVLGGCVTMLGKPTDTYTLCDTFIAKDNIFDCTHDTPSGSLDGELIIGLRVERARRAITKGNKFFNSQYLHGASGIVDLEVVEASSNEYVNTRVALYRVRRIITSRNTYRNPLSSAIYQADTSDGEGLISSIHEQFRGAGDSSISQLINIRTGKSADFDHLVVSDGRGSSELPLSVFGSFSIESAIGLNKPTIIGSYLDVVRPDSTIGSLKISGCGEVKGPENFMKNTTRIGGVKIYDSTFELTGRFLEDVNGGVAGNVIVKNNTITAYAGVAAEQLNNSSVMGNEFHCDLQAISSYSNVTPATDTYIRDNVITGTNTTPIDFFGDESSFVGNNWMYNCGSLAPLGDSDAGGNIERP